METVRGNGLSKRQNRVGSKKKHKGGEGDKQKGGKNKGKCQNAETVVKTDTVWWNTIGSGHTLECKMRIRHSRMWIQFQSIHVKVITQTAETAGGLTCGGICPPFFSQVSLGVGDPDARQYNLKVSPSWTPIFWGLTWTWGWLPMPLGLVSDQKNALWSVKLKTYIVYLYILYVCMFLVFEW